MRLCNLSDDTTCVCLSQQTNHAQSARLVVRAYPAVVVEGVLRHGVWDRASCLLNCLLGQFSGIRSTGRAMPQSHSLTGTMAAAQPLRTPSQRIAEKELPHAFGTPGVRQISCLNKPTWVLLYPFTFVSCPRWPLCATLAFSAARGHRTTQAVQFDCRTSRLHISSLPVGRVSAAVPTWASLPARPQYTAQLHFLRR